MIYRQIIQKCMFAVPWFRGSSPLFFELRRAGRGLGRTQLIFWVTAPGTRHRTKGQSVLRTNVLYAALNPEPLTPFILTCRPLYFIFVLTKRPTC
jgi:hypothetical protein